MPQLQFARQLQAYDKWKARLILTIEELRPWLIKHGMFSPDSAARIQRTLDTLKNDRLTVAFVAEFSRGKTELINAMFFADYRRRLLPSTPGRTTMCPTELFYDHDADDAYIRLLPIETRAREDSVSELKSDPENWVYYPLPIESPEQMEQTLKEVVRTKRVSIKESRRLGLHQGSLHLTHGTRTPEVDIPKWRHALISFPHPLLKQGLTILDTPGLNALGNEPELTLSLLPSAQAVLFVLTADAGVTRSDLDVWREHIRGSRGSQHSGLMVALNKIDVLWDELSETAKVEMTIQQQRIATADILGISTDTIFPVSAQKGLLAKIRNDVGLLRRSALLELESYLSHHILDNKRQIIQDMVCSDVGHMLENSCRIVNRKCIGLRKHLDEMKQLSGKSKDAISHMIQQTRDEQTSYSLNVEAYKTSRQELGEQSKLLREALDMAEFDAVVKDCHRQMSLRWTTRGLRKSMKTLFDMLQKNIQTGAEHSEQTQRIIQNIYEEFQNDYGFTVLRPPMFPITKYQVDLELLSKEADAFRNSPVTAVSEQKTVVKRFFHFLVSRARKIFARTCKDADSWINSALDPLTVQIQDHKEMMEKRLRNLKKLGQSKKTLQTRIQEVQDAFDATSQQLSMLQHIRNSLNTASLSSREADQMHRAEQRAAS